MDIIAQLNKYAGAGETDAEGAMLQAAAQLVFYKENNDRLRAALTDIHDRASKSQYGGIIAEIAQQVLSRGK